MTISAKNGSLILKNGSIAESCSCCGWSCYQDCGSGVCAPCGYSKPMPSSLNVSVAFDISSPIYMGHRGAANFGTAYWPSRVGPADFSLASRSFAIQFFSGCTYSGSNGTTFTDTHSVGLDIGGTGGLHASVGWDGSTCGSCFRRPFFTQLVLKTNALRPPNLNLTRFMSLDTGWANAAENEYSASSFFNSTPATEADSFPAVSQNHNGVLYPVAVALFGSKSTSVDVPQCNSIPYDAIDYTYKFDLIYTDCAGSSPALTRLARAVTVRIFE